MSSNNILLSICIPTFDRLHYLKESLDTLLPQAQRLGVEVCISDNHSTDGTPIYLGKIVAEYSCVRYITQDKNIGLDRNMASAISMGRGEYIYPLGDDDVIPVEALSTILKEIDGKVDLVIQNGWHTDAFLSLKRIHLSSDIQGRQITLPSIAFASLWDKMPFGSFLAARDYFDGKYFSRYLGTSHAYTGVIWDALAEKYEATNMCKVKCMAQPTVLLRGGEKSWRNDAAKIMLYEIPLWFSLIMDNDEYKDVAISIRIRFLNEQTSRLSLLRFRAMGQLECNNVEVLGKECSSKQLSRVYQISKVPKGLARMLIYCIDSPKRIIRSLLWK